MELFYCDPSKVKDSRIELDDFESKHIARTLRKKSGDPLVLCDGKGHKLSGHIAALKPRVCVDIETSVSVPPASPRVEIAMGFIRPQRLEWALEKATELGAAGVHLIRTGHSGYFSDNRERFNKILRQAMKQNLRYHLPELHLYPSLADFLKTLPSARIKCMAVDPHSPPLTHFLEGWDREKPLLYLVGPEGGLSDNETALLSAAGFSDVSLGAYRLRAETAVIAGLSLLMLK